MSHLFPLSTMPLSSALMPLGLPFASLSAGFQAIQNTQAIRDTLAGLLLASVWQGTVLALLVALGLRFLPGVSAATRSALWTVVLLLILFSPALAFHHTWAFAMASGAPSPMPVSPVTPVHLAESISSALLLLWAAASVWRGIQLTRSALRLRHLLRSARPAPASDAVAALLARAARPARLCTSTVVDRPSVAGFFRPSILLPPALLAALSEAELSQVVLHELEHLRRRDDWTNLLQQLALVALPLHPVLLWLDRQLARERELACDDGVLAVTHARKSYAACLARVAETSLVQRGLSLALGALGAVGTLGGFRRRSELALRVHRILDAAEPAPCRRQPRLGPGLLLAGTLGMSALLAGSPQLVSFTPATTTSVATGEAANAVRLPPTFTRPGALQTNPVKATLVSSPFTLTAFQPKTAALIDNSFGRLTRPQRIKREAAMRRTRVRRSPSQALRTLVAMNTLQANELQRSELQRLRMPELRNPQLAARTAQPSTSWLVLTAWQAGEPDAHSVALGNSTDFANSTVFSNKTFSNETEEHPVPSSRRHRHAAASFSQVWYTAVPFGDGWLVVQL